MALSSLAYLDQLLGDANVVSLMGTEADINAMIAFERGLAKAEAEHGLIEPAAAAGIDSSLQSFQPDVAKLSEATLKDGVVVPELVKQLRAAAGSHGSSVHFGATSQDVIDTALALKLKAVLAVFEGRLLELDATFDDLLRRFEHKPVMAQTRMQAAIEIAAGDRLRVWRKSIIRVAAELHTIQREALIVSLAGAAGTSEKFGDKIAEVRQSLAIILGLSVPNYVPHADRGRFADLANWLARLTGALGKLGQDVALMAQSDRQEIAISGGGGSSAMPHKQNPVRAEVLVALARFNAVQVSAVHQALIHEQERSGAAWTLEWMVLPQMIEAAGTALLHAQGMLSNIERIGKTV